jgi:bifunctional DNA-binding transcriptional regulator/antitoxin component of YhaV-PrlF toxin-antitoxin module
MAKKEDRVYTTTAFRQNDVSRSVRSTIPEPIAVLLGIENGTTVEWRVDGETRRVWVRAAKK